MYYISDDGYNYIDTFNEEWINTHNHDLSGPLYCDNCQIYGSVIENGIRIFLGYCLNCAVSIYKKKRGLGFSGFSHTFLVNNKCEYEYPDYLSKYKNCINEYIYMEKMRCNIDCDDCDKLSEKNSEAYIDSDDEETLDGYYDNYGRWILRY